LGDFQAIELPTEAEEIWRYSRISEIDIGRFAPVTAGAPSGTDAPRPLDDVLAAIGDRAGLLVTNNGTVTRNDLEVDGVEVRPLDDGVGAVSGEPDAFVTMNATYGTQPMLVRVARGTAIERPIVILHWIDRDGAAVFPPHRDRGR
jgi:hypothetical protein